MRAVIVFLFALINFSMSYAYIPNDPMLKDQWYLSKINMPKVWEMGLEKQEVIVAIIDTGIDFHHSEFEDKFWINSYEIANNGIDDDNNGYIDDIHGWDFQAHDNFPMDEDKSGVGHGTIVGGVIAASSNNHLGISGISDAAKLMVLRACDENGLTNWHLVAAAIDYAVNNGAQIINASFGGFASEGDEVLIKAVERALAKDVLIIASAGNFNINVDDRLFLPAALRLDNLISVAAADINDERWVGSNYGKKTIDIAAPGVSLLTTKLGGGYKAVTSTSIAAPVVTGVAALIKSIAPKLSSKQIKNVLMSTGCPVNIENVCDCRIDAYEAVNLVKLKYK